MGDITNNISLHESSCYCGCDTHLSNSEVKSNIYKLAYEIQLLVTILSLIYNNDKIMVLFKWGTNGGSWVRCPAHNKAVGGAENSWHPTGLAADPQFYRVKQTHKVQISPIVVCKTVLKASREGLLNFKGIGCYKTFSHLDMRNDSPAQWIRKHDGKYIAGNDFNDVNFG